MSLAIDAIRKERFAGVLTTQRGVVALISVLLFTPTLLFATTLRAPTATILIAGCLGALALVLQPCLSGDASFLDEPTDFRLLAGLIGFSAFLLVAGGALHLVYAPSDWRTRDAVLADVSRNWLPFVYDDQSGQYVLRAPLGMYMAPGLVGHAFGLAAGHVALWLQNSAMLGAILYVFARLGRGWRHAALMLAFSGCAALGVLIYWLLSDRTLLDHMVRYGMDSWNPYFQYSGSLVQFFWVPNHALPGWWLAALMILQARRQVDLATIGATIGAAMFWSPLAILPAVAWVALQALLSLRDSLTSRRLWALALAAPCFAPVAAYMVVGAGAIEHGVAATKPMFAVIYLVFVIAALAPAAYVLAYHEQLRPELRRPLVFSVVVLLLLPMFSFGPSNDLVMRGSIPALAILAFCFADVVLAPQSRAGRAFRAGVAIAILCLPSALYELARPTFRASYDISDCSLFEANAAMGMTGISANYVAPRSEIPNWLMDLSAAPSRASQARACWSDGGEPPADR
ncbi:MAG: hypothetical protein U1E28_20710 [Beijerinckiaceae bacterium]